MSSSFVFRKMDGGNNSMPPGTVVEVEAVSQKRSYGGDPGVCLNLVSWSTHYNTYKENKKGKQKPSAKRKVPGDVDVKGSEVRGQKGNTGLWPERQQTITRRQNARSILEPKWSQCGAYPAETNKVGVFLHPSNKAAVHLFWVSFFLNVNKTKPTAD